MKTELEKTKQNKKRISRGLIKTLSWKLHGEGERPRRLVIRISKKITAIRYRTGTNWPEEPVSEDVS
jgi:hypothetical protein